MAGPGGDLTHYLIHNTEERLRRERMTDFGTLQTLIASLSNKIEVMDNRAYSSITDLSTKMESANKDLITKMESANKDLITKMESANKDLSTKMESANKDLITKMESANKDLNAKMESLSKEVSALGTQFVVYSAILVAILLVVSTQVPFLQPLMSIILKFFK
jgi:phage-related tail fiber protein